MFEIKFNLRHHGCWTVDLSKKYKSRFTIHLTFSLKKNTTSDILHVHYKNDSEFEKIIRFLKRHSSIRRVDHLYQDDCNLYLQVYTNISKMHSVVGTIIKHRAFVSKHIIIADGFEMWTVSIPSKELLPGMIRLLRKCGDMKLLRVIKKNPDMPSLSRKQWMTLDLALELGYYEWPRRINAKELARRMKISKSTLLQHLRIGESKVMKELYLSWKV